MVSGVPCGAPFRACARTVNPASVRLQVRSLTEDVAALTDANETGLPTALASLKIMLAESVKKLGEAEAVSAAVSAARAQRRQEKEQKDQAGGPGCNKPPHRTRTTRGGQRGAHRRFQAPRVHL